MGGGARTQLVTKHDLLTSAELKLLGGSPSKLAALDYLVCLYAELFVQTLGGNMGHSLRVHRSYLGRYTLYPNRCAPPTPLSPNCLSTRPTRSGGSESA